MYTWNFNLDCAKGAMYFQGPHGNTLDFDAYWRVFQRIVARLWEYMYRTRIVHVLTLIQPW